MDVLTFRPLVESDAPAVLEILVAAEVAEPADAHYDLTEVQEDLSQPGVNLAEGSVAVRVGERLAGFGTLFTPPVVDKWTAYLGGAVAPEFRRTGIGREILQRLITKADALRQADGTELPGELKIWISHGRASAAALAGSAGFQVRRYFFDMRADLTAGVPVMSRSAGAGVPVMSRSAGIEVRTWSPADDENTRLAYNAAFADHWGSVPMDTDRWRTTFAESSFFRPEFSRLALLAGEVVGFVLVDEFPAETAAHGYRTGYIDRVGTVRSVRGRGIAAALLADSMTALAGAGVRYADLGVDADSPTGAGRLYERLGFTVRHRNEVVGLDF
jgi:mycothiol synthase